MHKDPIEDIKHFLKTPRDISKMSNEKKANHITLYLIGYLARPKGVSAELLQECCNAFNNNRGKVEWEEAAVLKVLEENDTKTKI